MAKHSIAGFGQDEEMQESGEPSGHSALPGRHIKMGQHGKPLPGFHDGHDGQYPHEVHPHIAHSPRTHHGDL